MYFAERIWQSCSQIPYPSVFAREIRIVHHVSNLGRRTPGQHLGGGRAARRDKFGGEADAATVRGQPRGDAGVPTWLRRTGSRPTSYRSHTWSRYRTSRLSSRSGGSSSNSIVTGLAESVAGVNVWCNLRQASAASS